MTDQYSSTERFNLAARTPKWIHDSVEGRRVAAYGVYEDIYWSQPETFAITQHAAEKPPVYIPSGRIIVETLNRHMAHSLNFAIDPEMGTPNDQALAQQMLDDLIRRERFLSKFNMAKRGGIIRGDWAFHIYANEEREEGSRVSVYPIHPGTLFPIYDPSNIDIIIGWHIAEAILLDDETYISRKTYRKLTEAEGPSPITYEHGIYEVDNWGGPGDDPAEIKLLRVEVPLTTLPDPIDHLPIYHIPNFTEDGTLWGSSEMRGLETLFNSQQQNVSDEDVSLAMDGLGMYWTDGGTPVDEDGNDIPWNLGPGRVAELPEGRKMGRLSGLGSVAPYQSHVDWLQGWAERGRGITDVATGSGFDVALAESGVALAIRLAPILSSAEEREQVISDRLGNMFHDMKKWYAAFEDGAFNNLVEAVRITTTYGPKLPVNEEKYVNELMALNGAGILPASYVRDELRRMGRTLPDEATMVKLLADEAASAAQISTDTVGARMDAEAGGFV